MPNAFAAESAAPLSRPAITVVADDREKKSGVIEWLANAETISLKIRRLILGDYQIENRIAVERKTLNDFALSIADGRLFPQMIRLTRSNLKGVCIIEGSHRDISRIGVKRAAMQGALITISVMLGIPVLRSVSPSETAHLLLYMARQLRWADRKVPRRKGYPPKGNRKRRLFILQGLPGIGRERADRLLKHFGSIESVITARSIELQAVTGIGARIAENIRRAVT